jgi:hypothetical protein
MNITQADIDLMDKTEKAISNEMRLLFAEGVPSPIILAGLTSAIASLLHSDRDPDAVGRYFEKQAAAARSADSPT